MACDTHGRSNLFIELERVVDIDKQPNERLRVNTSGVSVDIVNRRDISA
jgi:hypothetical protein